MGGQFGDDWTVLSFKMTRLEGSHIIKDNIQNHHFTAVSQIHREFGTIDQVLLYII